MVLPRFRPGIYAGHIREIVLPRPVSRAFPPRLEPLCFNGTSRRKAPSNGAKLHSSATKRTRRKRRAYSR